MKRLFSIILIIVIIIPLFSGCRKEDIEVVSSDSPKDEQNISTNDTATGNNVYELEGSLTVYCDYNTKYISFFRLLVLEFNKIYPNVEIIEYDPTDGNSSIGIEAKLLKFNTDMMAGKGPDVIISNGSLTNYKAITSGIFLDLNQLIYEDSSFNLDLYEKAVLDAGVFGDKRLTLPFLHHTNSLMTTEERLSELEIPPNSLSTPEGILSAFEVAANNRQLPYMQINQMAWYSWLEDLFDYENNTVDANNIYLHRVVDLFKVIDNRTNQGYIFSNTKKYFDEIYETEAFYIDPSITFRCAYYQAHDTKCKMVELPNDYGGTTATVFMYSAINQNCKNPKLAWEFIKCTLNKSLQSSYHMFNGGFPVLRSVQDDTYSALCRQGTWGDTEHTDKMIAFFIESRSPITSAIYRFESSDIEGFLYMFEPYFNDENSYEECLAEAINYYSIYLSE